jgi:hypothetical protein
MQELLNIIQEMKHLIGTHDQVAHGSWAEGLGGVRMLPAGKLDYATMHDINSYADKWTPTDDRLARTRLYVETAKIWDGDAKLLLAEPMKEMAGMLEAYSRAIGSDPVDYTDKVEFYMKLTNDRIGLTSRRSDSNGILGVKREIESELRNLAKEVAKDTAETEQVAKLAGRVLGLYRQMHPPTDEMPPAPTLNILDTSPDSYESYLYDL